MSHAPILISPTVLPADIDVKAIQEVFSTIPQDNLAQVDILNKDCTPLQVTAIIITQINGLCKDIRELEEFKESLKSVFPKDMKSYRSTFVIENKTKMFVGFYSTILEYKRELNSMLLKLRAILDVGTDLEKYKQAIREVIIERATKSVSGDENKKKMEELLKKSPGLMPTSL